jgi:acyl phosphate:glycerol-3-phosphate acyltransferase
VTIHPAAMIAVGFLSGSIPFGLLIGRLKGIDIRKHGSGNIGASNVGRVLGTRYFFVCFALDVLKGTLPTLAMGYLLGRLGSFSMPPRDAWWWLGGMVAPVMGHVFSPWLKFKGGKGVATFFGTLLAAAWPVGLLAGATWILMAAVFRVSSLAALTAAVLAPVYVLVLHRPHPIAVLAVVMAALIYLRHAPNIRRLLNGEEPRIGGSKKAAE